MHTHMHMHTHTLTHTHTHTQPYSLKEKVQFILRATFQHAKNLACLATIYKIITLALRKLLGKGHPIQNFVAAFVGGYVVFGENNKVNMQVSVLHIAHSKQGLMCIGNYDVFIEVMLSCKCCCTSIFESLAIGLS